MLLPRCSIGRQAARQVVVLLFPLLKGEPPPLLMNHILSCYFPAFPLLSLPWRAFIFRDDAKQTKYVCNLFHILDSWLPTTTAFSLPALFIMSEITILQYIWTGNTEQHSTGQKILLLCGPNRQPRGSKKVMVIIGYFTCRPAAWDGNGMGLCP